MRFSLRSIFILMAGVAVYTALLFARPDAIAGVTMSILSALLLPITVGGVIYAQNAWRAFWIGCAVGILPMTFLMLMTGGGYFFIFNDMDDASSFRTLFAILHGYILLNGLIVVGVRWFCLHRLSKQSAAPNNPTEIHEKIS